MPARESKSRRAARVELLETRPRTVAAPRGVTPASVLGNQSGNCSSVSLRLSEISRMLLKICPEDNPPLPPPPRFPQKENFIPRRCLVTSRTLQAWTEILILPRGYSSKRSQQIKFSLRDKGSTAYQKVPH